MPLLIAPVMDLNWIKLQGYKRLELETLKTAGKVIAIVGPNEAGKSSILKALEHLNHGNRFSESELTRREKRFKDDDVILEAGFLLDDEDRAAISHLYQGDGARQFRICKLVDGNRRGEIVPPAQQELSHYYGLRDVWKSLDESGWRELHLKDDIVNQLKQLISELDNTHKHPSPSTLLAITSELKKISPSENIKELEKPVRQLLFHLSSLIAQKSDPDQKAEEILFQRIPRILVFDSDQRDLNSVYDLSQSAKSPPSALRNLADLAGLDLISLNSYIANNNQAKVQSLLNKANTQIANVVGGKWSQSGVRVSLRTDQSILHIFIQDGQDCTELNERSDGLRQFVALINFLEAEHAAQPVLLIDEAETHLHYDAQADLMNMFARQNVASKIIYTTHSIGCLPEDLGTGVRCVVPIRNTEKSEIRNWFWQDSRPGFSPLLFAIGASNLAFVPIRKAVFVEGAVDMLLLPTMFRQVCRRSFLGFQIAPGLSIAAGSNLSLLENEAPRVAFLADNDAAGKKLAEQLKKAGIDRLRIFNLCGEDGSVLEDFVNKELYVEAINNALQNWNNHAPTISSEDLPDINRPKVLERWCKEREIQPPDKKIIAYRLLDFAIGERQEFLVQGNLEQPLRELYENIAQSLNL